jgi:hypothetical protein
MRLIRKICKGGSVGRAGFDQKDVVSAKGSRAVRASRGTIKVDGVPAAPEGYDLISIEVLRLKPSRQPMR